MVCICCTTPSEASRPRIRRCVPTTDLTLGTSTCTACTDPAGHLATPEAPAPNTLEVRLEELAQSGILPSLHRGPSKTATAGARRAAAVPPSCMSAGSERRRRWNRAGGVAAIAAGASGGPGSLNGYIATPMIGGG